MAFVVGDKTEQRFEITDEAIRDFAQISGDNNPLHLDDEFARKSRFGRRTAHGFLAASYISAVLGTKLPGEGTIYLGQKLEFKKPVFLSDTVTVFVEITAIREDKPIYTLSTRCSNQDGVDVILGEAVVSYSGQ